MASPFARFVRQPFALRLARCRRSRRAAARTHACRLRLEQLEDRTAPAQLTVVTASDAVAHTGMSLRDAIVQANTDAAAGTPGAVGHVLVFGQGAKDTVYLRTQPITVTVQFAAGGNQPQMTVNSSNLSQTDADAPPPVTIGGANATQTITVANDIAYGTFTLTFNGKTTVPIYPTGEQYLYPNTPAGLAHQIEAALNSIAGAAGPVTATANISNTQLTIPAVILGGPGANVLNASGGNRSGSSANNVLVGGTGQDSLTGGSGRDILIGGGGPATLQPGSSSSDDILIAGSTTYDANVAALVALMAEWSRTDITYQQRVQDLFGDGGGGLNGSYFLNAQTVARDTARSHLFGYGGQDWFWVAATRNSADTIYYRSGDVATFE